MKNADRIRTMTDEELWHFIWWWQINTIKVFMTAGGFQDMLDAQQIYEWLQSEEFKCKMTRTPEDEE